MNNFLKVNNAQKNQVLAELKKNYLLTNQQEQALSNYVDAILQENQKFNFIGKSTIQDIWHRHILDSAQLFTLIDNKNQVFADFGSGCGLPGLVLSILGIKEIHLIEKSFRKAEFLKKYRSLSQEKVLVHQTFLENITINNFDVIVSRAFAPLPKLLGYVTKFLNPNGYCLFLKGKNLLDEISLAQQNFIFNYNLTPSITSTESKVIKISNIIIK
jgi:16S rRNA (guanine527-N7)-methyltransferase